MLQQKTNKTRKEEERMRKMMTREVTTTKIKIAQLTMVEGKPEAVTLPDETILGNVTLEKAQLYVTKKHGQGVTVFSVEADTKTYEMSVEDFIEYASLKEEVVPA